MAARTESEPECIRTSRESLHAPHGVRHWCKAGFAPPFCASVPPDRRVGRRTQSARLELLQNAADRPPVRAICLVNKYGRRFVIQREQLPSMARVSRNLLRCWCRSSSLLVDNIVRMSRARRGAQYRVSCIDLTGVVRAAWTWQVIFSSRSDRGSAAGGAKSLDGELWTMSVIEKPPPSASDLNISRAVCSTGYTSILLRRHRPGLVVVDLRHPILCIGKTSPVPRWHRREGRAARPGGQYVNRCFLDPISLPTGVGASASCACVVLIGSTHRMRLSMASQFVRSAAQWASPDRCEPDLVATPAGEFSRNPRRSACQEGNRLRPASGVCSFTLRLDTSVSRPQIAQLETDGNSVSCS